MSVHKWSSLKYDKILYHEGADKQFHSLMVACGAPLKLSVQSKVKFQFTFKSFQQDALSVTHDFLNPWDLTTGWIGHEFLKIATSINDYYDIKM